MVRNTPGEYHSEPRKPERFGSLGSFLQRARTSFGLTTRIANAIAATQSGQAAPHFAHGGEPMSRRMSWILTAALTVLGSSGCGLFCDRYCERNHCDHHYDRCGCGSTNYAPPANNCCPSP